MLAVRMLRGTRFIYCLIYLVHLIGCAYTLPLQFLPSIPGYIPVYIRHGDQPLEDINPALAEAFLGSPIPRKSIRFDDLSPHIYPKAAEKNRLRSESENFHTHVNSVNVRQVQEETGTSDDDIKDKDNRPGQKNSEIVNVPKLVSANGLPGSTLDEEYNKGKKLTGVTKEISKNLLGKLTGEVEKTETRFNDPFVSSLNYSELPTEGMEDVHNIPVPESSEEKLSQQQFVSSKDYSDTESLATIVSNEDKLSMMFPLNIENTSTSEQESQSNNREITDDVLTL